MKNHRFQGYQAGVEWIALEDAPGDNLEPEGLAGTLTVCMLADLTGRDPKDVAMDVWNYRQMEGRDKTA